MSFNILGLMVYGVTWHETKSLWGNEAYGLNQRPNIKQDELVLLSYMSIISRLQQLI